MPQATATQSRNTLSGAYTIDPVHSRIGFVARHAMVTKVRGSFNEFEGGGYFDEDAPSRSHLELTIEASSIDTRSADRDAHLRSNDFLAMDEFPQIRFVSTAVEATGAGTYRVTGDLTMRGVARPVDIELELTGSSVDPYGNQRIGLEGRASIDRKDWGITWNTALEAGGMLVSNKVSLEFEVSAIRSVA